MNLPIVNARESIVQRASLDFGDLCQTAMDMYVVNKLDVGEVIVSYNQIIINLLSGHNEVHNDFQHQVENALESVKNKYQLTLGEQMLLIAEKSKSNIDYVLSWERESK